VGGSAGGLLAAWLGTVDAYSPNGTNARVQAVVSLWAPWDLTTPEVDSTRNARGTIERLLGPSGMTARGTSPLFAIGTRSAPTLFIHGTNDSSVPISQSRCARSRAAGAQCELVQLAGEGDSPERSPSVARITHALQVFAATHTAPH
jgi:acetyl esterase